MAALRVPSMNQILSLAVTMMALLFILKVLPIPENIKNLFRI